MKTAIAIFVKTPGLSPVKTRLAQTIGKEKAEAFYNLSLGAIIKTMQQVNSNIFWAVAEKEGIDNPLWQDFDTIYTGEGGLGPRQHHIYSTLLLQHDRVCLIGADTPQISSDILQNAIDNLDNNNYVIGPANDGGYYLFGGNKPVELETWNKVPWSTEKTRETLENLLPIKPAHLAFLTDVDTEDDLLPAMREMPEIMSDEQQRIVDWANQSN